MLFLGAILLLACTFYLLSVVTDEFFVPALEEISDRLKLSSDVAGATFMAMGSSAPEFFTSLIAVFSLSGHADVGAGTIVGSAIFNILVIIGVSAAFRRATLHWQPVVRDTLFYSLSIILLMLVFWDGVVRLSEALWFVGLYAVYILVIINWKKLVSYTDLDPLDILEEASSKNKLAQFSSKLVGYVIPDCTVHPERYMLTFGASVGVIAVLSYIMVESAIFVAESLHISPAIIALTVLAAGTSIPDLLASVTVAKKGRGDMAVSNAIGSNIFDILFGLGVPWTLLLLWKGGTVAVATENLLSSVFLLFATVLAVFFLLAVRKWSIGKRAGLLLVGLYVLYLVWSVYQVVGGSAS